MWHWIRVKAWVRIWFWIATLYCLCFKQIDGCFLDGRFVDLSHFADFGKVSYFADSGKLSRFLDGYFLDGCSLDGCFLDGCFWLLVWKIPLGETGCLGNPYFLFNGCLSIQFFSSPVRQSVRSPVVTYPSLWNTCVTYGTSCHANAHQVLPTHPLPREAEDFPRGESILTMFLCSHA